MEPRSDRMFDRTDQDWTKWGDEDPYFAVLTTPEFHHDQFDVSAKARFFATGREHIERIFGAIHDRFLQDFQPHTALDFGCGTGRLLPALAARWRSVLGIDVSSGMRAEAEKNCREFGLTNVSVIASDDALAGIQGDFDLIHSCLVLQHINPRRGERILAQLFRRLSPGGIAAFQFPIQDRNSPWFSFAFWLKDQVPGLYGLVNLSRGRRWSYPSIQMHCYSLDRVLDLASAVGVCDAFVQKAEAFGYMSVTVYLQRPK